MQTSPAFDLQSNITPAPAEKRTPLQVLRSINFMNKPAPETKMALAIGAKSQPVQAFGVLHVYAGTVPAATKAKRRAANRVARKSRAINRHQ